MARKRRCSLCGAKLKGDICQECGYNNKAYHYKINTSSEECQHSSSEKFYDKEEHEKHSDPKAEAWKKEFQDTEKKKKRPLPNVEEITYGLNETRPKQKKKKHRWLKWLLLILFLLGTLDFVKLLIFEMVSQRIVSEENLASEILVTEEGAESEKAEEAAAVPEETQTAGSVENPTEFGPGIYVAGLHFPAGIYEAQYICGSGSFYVQNLEEAYWESAYLYERSSKKEQKLEKLQMTFGTQMKITDDLQMKLTVKKSEGYDPKRLEKRAESEAEKIKVTDGMIVGKDLPEGTYQVIGTPQEGKNGSLAYKFVNIFEEEQLEQICFQEPSSCFENLTFSQGDVLLTMNCEAVLLPAEYDLSGEPKIW